MPEPARPGIRFAQAAGLTVFLATAALLVSLVLTRLVAGIGSLQAAAVAFSTAAGAIACIAMLLDAIDLWLRGRRMTPYSVKMFRSLVFVAVLGALAGSVLGGNSLLLLLLGPSMVIYFFIVRRPNTVSSAPGRVSQRRPQSSTPGSARSRQRRGGKKHR